MHCSTTVPCDGARCKQTPWSSEFNDEYEAQVSRRECYLLRPGANLSFFRAIARIRKTFWGQKCSVKSKHSTLLYTLSICTCARGLEVNVRRGFVGQANFVKKL